MKARMSEGLDLFLVFLSGCAVTSTHAELC